MILSLLPIDFEAQSSDNPYIGMQWNADIDGNNNITTTAQI